MQESHDLALLLVALVPFAFMFLAGIFAVAAEDPQPSAQVRRPRREKPMRNVGTVFRHVRWTDGTIERVGIDLLIDENGRRHWRVCEAGPNCRRNQDFGEAAGAADAWLRTGTVPDGLDESLSEAMARFAENDRRKAEADAAEELRRLEKAADAREERRAAWFERLGKRAEENRSIAAKREAEDAKRAAKRAAEDGELAAKRAAQDEAHARQAEKDAAAEAEWRADPRSSKRKKKKRKEDKRRKSNGTGPSGTVAEWLADLGLEEIPSDSGVLKAARNRRIFEAHPDKGGSTEDAIRVNNAYDGLSAIVG